jgi:hypothetical protein
LFREDAISLGVQREIAIRVEAEKRGRLGIASVVYKVADVDAHRFELLHACQIL